MKSYRYIKDHIRKKGLSLQDVAINCGLSKSYLSQLINGNIKNPSANKLNAIHQFLDLDLESINKKTGIIVGKFYPLHTGHIHLIQRAISQVDEVVIILCHDEDRDQELFKNSAMSKQPTLNDRMRWLLQTFKYQKNIRIETLNEKGIPRYPNGWKEWTSRVKELFIEKNIQPCCVFSSEKQDVAMYKKLLDIDTVLIDPKRKFIPISGTKIRQAPLQNWQYIPTEVKPFFVKTVAILGGESSGKTTIINKLANVFNTSSAWEYGREYVFDELGGDERALQFSDYSKIALGQAKYIDFAIKYANKIAFVDTDFVTTQAFCKKYEGKEHPFVQTMINHYRFDLVILLNNNTPWIADGLRHLGTEKQRTQFQKIIISLLKKNNIPFITIDSPNYEERYMRCIEIISTLLNDKEIHA